jgi:hypothetical protein
VRPKISCHPLSHAFIARSKSMNVCRPKKKKAPPPSPVFGSHARLPVFLHEISTARHPPKSKNHQLGSRPPRPPLPSSSPTRSNRASARTSQLHPFSLVSSSALGHAPPTDSHRRSLAGASTHRFGSSRPARVVVALLHRRAISSCGGRFSGAGGTCEG